MLIHEAFVYGRPLLVSDIGGMGEKVRHGVDGLHVATGNRPQWARALREAASATEGWDTLRSGIVPPLSHAACARAHLDMMLRPAAPLMHVVTGA